MWKWLGITDGSKVAELADKTEPSQGDCTMKSTEESNKSHGTKSTTEMEDTTSSVETTENIKDVAANLGSYLYSFATVATKTASKLKESVDEKLEKTIVGDFKRENEKFILENEARRVGDAVPPWVGYHEESAMKRRIMALSADERNFLRDPPSGVDFHFDMSHMMPIALAVLREDEDLKTMRFKLVPKRVKEDKFWRNYFYRVSLIKQSTQLSSMADTGLRCSPSSSSTENLTIKGTEKTEEIASHEQLSPDVSEVDTDVLGSPNTNEFVSDAFQTDEAGLSEEEKNQMLGMTNKTDEPVVATSETDDWEIEKELQDEIESFELVNDDIPDDGEDGNWEKEIEFMLELEDENVS